MRRLALAGLAAAFLLAAYAAAGYWLAPRLVRDAVVEQAGRLGLEVRLGDVRTDPFRLSVALSGIEVRGPGGSTLASAQDARVDLAWASIWGDAWIVQRASVHQPKVSIELDAKGELSWPLPAADRQSGDEPRGVPLVVLEQLAVLKGRLEFVDRSRGPPARLQLETVNIDATGLASGAAQPGDYAVSARVVGGGALSSKGKLALDPLSASGSIEATEVSIPVVWQLAAPSAPGAQGRLSATAAYVYRDSQLTLEDVSAHAADVVHRGIALAELSVEAEKVAVPPSGPIEIAANAKLKSQGSASAQGSIALHPLSADLRVIVKDLQLAQAQPWLPEHMAVDIVSGALSAQGRVRWSETGGAYDGAVAIGDARIVEAKSGELLLAWRNLETREAHLRFAPLQVELGDITARAPRGRLIIEADGRVNFARVLGAGDAADDGQPPSIAVRRLRVEEGALEFADHSLATPFAVSIRELSGAVSGFGTLRDDPARLQLAGRVEKYGSARIRGTINLQDPKALANISARFRNLDMTALTPYAAKFAGYRIESGRLSAELRYQVRDGALSGENQLVIERLNLGEKVQSTSALDVPLELAVALLADSEGRINLGIPVSGNLNDPQFDFGGLIARAIRNAITKVVSAPFRALAALLGGGAADLDSVRFAAGSASLSPPAEENVAKVARALSERPQLGVGVRGGYDPQADLAALRIRAAREEIARRARQPVGAPLDFGDEKVLHAAENLYLERVGNRLELQELRSRAPRYGRALVEKLAATVTLPPQAAEALAHERAQTVRAALVEHGVEGARVQLDAPVAQAPESEGIATVLALSADLPPQPTVSEVQRALNSAGFDAGAVDGILGPQTQAALRRFQEAQGLDATGDLNDRTLAALGLEGGAATGATRR